MPTQREDLDVTSVADARAVVEAVPTWYHTIDFGEAGVSRGWFDLRPIVDRLPWPDVRGKRCLDVGTADGFLAFEMERRGAAEVVAVDLPDHTDWDFSIANREGSLAFLRGVVGPVKSRGFDVASSLLHSGVQRVAMSVYDLSEERMGRFDVVVCGSLMLHLKEPLRALEAIRSVCGGGWFLSSESISLRQTLVNARTPAAVFLGGTMTEWWVPNLAGHRRMVESTGFRIVRTTRPYAIRRGAAHPPRPAGLRSRAVAMLERAMCGDEGIPHAALLAQPI